MASKQTLVQRIALDGGADIEKELKSIGADGEAMWKKLKDGADKLAASSTGVNKFFAQVRSDLDTISKGSKKVSEGFDDIDKGVKKIVAGFTTIAVAAGGVVFALEKISETASEAADVQGKAAASAGLNIKTYGRLQFAFEQGNVASEAFGIGIKKFNTVLADAAKGGATSSALFRQLGVSVLDANGKLRPTEAILGDIADKFAKLPNSATKSALAVQLFGKSGQQFIPVLNDGSAAIKDLGDQAERTGTVFTEVQAIIGDAFTDAKNKLVRDISGIKDQVGLTLAPAFTTAFATISKVLEDNQGNIIAFVTTITNQLIPAIKDIANALAGNDSAVVNKNILAIRDGFEKVGQAVLNVIDILTTVFTVLKNTIQPIVDLYNATLGQVFGQIDAQTAIITVALLAVTGVFRGVGLAIKGTSLVLDGLTEIFGTTIGKIIAVSGRVLLLQGLLKTLVDDMVKSFGDALTAVTSGFKGATDAIAGFFSGLGNIVKSIIDSIVSAIKAAIDLGKSLVGALPGGGGGDGSSKAASGFASGGHVRGAGSGTSDSILARLSNGEFVMRAAAVRNLGIDFLNSLNSGRTNGFAMGGAIGDIRPRSGLPAFAAGGLVQAPRTPINLSIAGVEFTDLLAPADVAAKVVQYAMGQKVRSGGKKPSWKKA